MKTNRLTILLLHTIAYGFALLIASSPARADCTGDMKGWDLTGQWTVTQDNGITVLFVVSGGEAPDPIFHIRGDLHGFAAAHTKLYRGRLWINQLARAAVLRPWLANGILEFAHLYPRALQFLTSKVISPATVASDPAAKMV